MKRPYDPFASVGGCRTRTGVKITPRFLKKDKRDLKRFSKLWRIFKSGRLTEDEKRRILIPLNRLHNTHIHRHGPLRVISEQEQKAREELLRQTRTSFVEIKSMVDALVKAGDIAGIPIPADILEKAKAIQI